MREYESAPTAFGWEGGKQRDTWLLLLLQTDKWANCKYFLRLCFGMKVPGAKPFFSPLVDIVLIIVL